MRDFPSDDVTRAAAREFHRERAASRHPPLSRAALDAIGVGRTGMDSVAVVPAQPSGERQGPLPEPRPLPEGLRPVKAFDPEYLPQSIAPWVLDIAERMQCPPDFVAIPALVGLGSILGRKMAIRPQRKTDWFEVANLWGCIVGRPGALKSPAVEEALKPLRHAEKAAREAYDEQARAFALDMEAFKLSKEAAAQKARKTLKEGNEIGGGDLDLHAPEEPKDRRYVVNDTSYEALGEILSDNPNGVLVSRDELVSLLKTLDREDYAAARGFYLTAWNGTSGYSFDRITRGKTHIDAACLSLIGGTQPGRLAEYVRRAISGGAADDGLIQRFGLLVWPDQVGDWKEVDRFPDIEARERAWGVYHRLDALDPSEAGAEIDQFQTLPFLRFAGDAQGTFAEWRAGLEARLRSSELSPALESHFAKYRKLVPALALITHLADEGSGPISQMAVLRALAMTEYLESHAQRAYAAGSEIEIAAAKAILSRIRKGDLPDSFTARDVHQRGWANLTDRDQVGAGLSLLVDLDWLFAETLATGGRPRTTYKLNPRGRA